MELIRFDLTGAVQLLSDWFKCDWLANLLSLMKQICLPGQSTTFSQTKLFLFQNQTILFDLNYIGSSRLYNVSASLKLHAIFLLTKALSKMKNNKSPGPDGFTVESIIKRN